MQSILGYKATNSNMTCCGYKYELGKKFIHEGDVSLCNSGFHFCEVLNRVFNYYNRRGIRIFKVIGSGTIDKDEYSKYACSTIEFVQELTWNQITDIVIAESKLHSIQNLEMVQSIINNGTGYRGEELCRLTGLQHFVLCNYFLKYENYVISSQIYNDMKKQRCTNIDGSQYIDRLMNKSGYRVRVQLAKLGWNNEAYLTDKHNRVRHAANMYNIRNKASNE